MPQPLHMHNNVNLIDISKNIHQGDEGGVRKLLFSDCQES